MAGFLEGVLDPSIVDWTKYHAEGYNAALRGLEDEDCPYPNRDDDRRRAWLDGRSDCAWERNE